MSSKRLSVLALSLALAVTAIPVAGRAASVNAGERPYTKQRPFAVQPVASFDTPWAIAFLPDGRMLVTEKPGRLFLTAQDGQKLAVAGVPAVAASGQNGLLDVAVAPDFASSGTIYLTYIGTGSDDGRMVLARGRLATAATGAALADLHTIWRQQPAGGGGQPGGIVAFDPQGQHLFLSVGDRMQGDSAQDADAARGKVLRLNLDGTVPADNPQAAAGGVRALTWTTGHRNPYGLAFATDGQLWLNEMGPRGGDEFNRIVAGQNYGWPAVSNGDNYDGRPIPRHATRPDFTAPEVYWTPVIAPAGLAFYDGAMFPQWRGSALIGGLAKHALVRVGFGADGQPDEADRWDMNARIRDVAVAPDGAVWVIEDSDPGRLLRLVPAP